MSAEDPLAPQLNDIDDVRVHMPGAIEAVHKWLKYYKTPVVNEFAYGGAAQPRVFAERLIEETHEAWQALIEARGAGATVSKDA